MLNQQKCVADDGSGGISFGHSGVCFTFLNVILPSSVSTGMKTKTSSDNLVLECAAGRVLPFFGEIKDSFVSWCVDRGLTPVQVQRHIYGFGKLVSWFRRKHIQRPQDLSEDDITQLRVFYSHRSPPLARTVVVFGEYLKTVGSLMPAQTLRLAKPGSWRQYRELPVFGSIVDDYARWCLDRGFALHTISMHLDALRRLAPWFLRRNKLKVTDLSVNDLTVVRRFYRARKRWLCPAVYWLGVMLQERGLLKPEHPPPKLRSEVEVARFAAHLRKDCDLARGTMYNHCHYVQRFLQFLGFDRGKFFWRDLTIFKVEEFVCRMSRSLSRRAMPAVVGTLRKFLRFQFQNGSLRAPLHLHLQTVRIYRDERLPQPLPWAQLQKLLRLMDHSTPEGRRDYAILVLAASYGLRCSEVMGLTLDDIDWRSRVLRLTQPKTGQKLQLPLTDEVAKALVDYLERGRPCTKCRQLFMRVRPPSGPLRLHGIACSLKRAIRSTGVDIQTGRFHALRHAFALRLLLEGTPLKHISEVMGHRSINSTSVYLRLDTEDLRQVALSVPPALSIARRRKLGHCSHPSGSPSAERKNRWPGSVTAPLSAGFRSFVARQMREFLRLRAAFGRDPQGDTWLLRNLDFFLANHYPRARVFSADLFEHWVREHLALSPTTRCRWMRFIRKFCLYLSRTEPDTFVPDPRTFPRLMPAKAPCLLSQDDVARLLAATHRPRVVYSREHPLRPKTIRLALLLFYCCGLRRSEAVNLTLADVDTQQRVLRIKHAKFHKSRLVPVSTSLNRELCRYLRERRIHKTPMDPSAPLLWSGQAGGRANGGFSGGGLRFNWQQICRYAGVFNQRGVPPRIHDLRHSFAVTVLQRSYRAGHDPQVTLPRLARYMGHVGFQFTHYYLQFTEPLRQSASLRFRRLIGNNLLSSTNPKPPEGLAR